MIPRKISLLAIPLLACAALFAAQTASAATVCCSCKGPPDPSKTTCLQIESDKLGSETDCSKLKEAAKLPSDWSCDAAAISADACTPVSGGKASAKCVVGPKSAYEIAGQSVAAPSEEDQKPPPIPLVFNTPIPGLTLTAVSGNAFGQYVAAAFRYGLSIVAIAATVMFVFGAFLYLLGSAITSIQAGKRYMTDAVIGLLLVMGSSFLLRTLNPDTVSLAFVEVEAIKAAAAANEFVADPNTKSSSKATAQYQARFEQFTPDELRGSAVYPADSSAVPQPLKVPALKQFLGPWAYTAYGPSGVSACPDRESKPLAVVKCCTIYRHSGCGPTSLATLLKFNGIETDPQQVGSVLAASGGRVCNDGTLLPKTSIDAVQKAYPNIRLVPLGGGVKGLVASIGKLRNGQPIMFLCAGCSGKTSRGTIKSYRGHFMVLTGVDPNGQIFSVDDVGNNDPYAIVSSAQSQLLGHVLGYWVVEKK